MSKARFKRVTLKLSGEALQGAQGYGIDPEVLETIAKEVQAVVSAGVETTIVIGGGNIFRGVKASARGMDRASADYMGMLATVINALALQRRPWNASGAQDPGPDSAINIQEVAEPYIRLSGDRGTWRRAAS